MKDEKGVKKQLLGIDIDGVFNIVSLEDSYNEIRKTPVHYLNKIMETLPNCDILITSSWGNPDNKTVEALVNAGFEYADRVVGATGFNSEKYSRTNEIVDWLTTYDRMDYYDVKVYLDDGIELFDYFSQGASRHQVVHCRSDRGLDIDKAYETICRLQGISLKFWT